MSTYKIITGGNDLYILTILDFLNYHCNNGFNESDIIFYNFGLSENNYNQISQKYKNMTIKTLDYEQYPEYVNPSKFNGIYCSYAFKTIAIYNEAIISDCNIIWMDIANRFTINSVNNINNCTSLQGFYCSEAIPANVIESLELNHITCLRTMNVLDEYTQIPMIASGIVGINYRSEFGKFITDEWYKYALIKDAIFPDGSSRNNHRQDQSILSIIIYLYRKNHNITFEKSTFGVRFWCKKDITTVQNIYKPFRLIDKQNNRQMAIIHCENLNEAIRVYAVRKHINDDQLLEKYNVL